MKNKLLPILEMLVIAAAGLVLLFNPGKSLTAAVKIIGVALLVYGVFAVARYLIAKKGAADLVGGGIAVVLGLVLLIAPKLIAGVFPVVVGLLIAVAGLKGIVSAVSGRKGSRSWLLACVFSAVTLIVGVVILFNPFKAASTVVVVLGIVLIYIGVTGIIAAVKA